jgi:hypothetical protein
MVWWLALLLCVGLVHSVASIDASMGRSPHIPIQLGDGLASNNSDILSLGHRTWMVVILCFLSLSVARQ